MVGVAAQVLDFHIHQEGNVKIKMVCGAIVSSVTLASGVAVAQDVTAEGHTTQATVVTIKGDDAMAYLPAYRNMLEQKLKSSDPQERASATEILHMLDQNQLKTLQIQAKSFGSVATGRSLLPSTSNSANVVFPENPTNGETFTISSCSLNTSSNMFFQTVQEWEYYSSSANWIQIKDDVDRVTTCPPL